MNIPTEYHVLVTRASNYIVTEEAALSLTAQFRNGTTLLHVDLLDGGELYLPREHFWECAKSTPDIRRYEWQHNANVKAEKAAAGFFDPDED